MLKLEKSKLVSLPTTILLVVVVVVIRFYVFPVLSSFPNKVPDELMFYSSNELFQIISEYSNSDINNYILTSLGFDFIFPVLYGFMFLFVKLLLFRWLNIERKFKFINIMAFLPVFFDFTENIGIMYMLKKLPNFNINLAEILGFITLLKYLTMFIFVLLVMIIANYTISYRIRHSIPIITGGQKAKKQI
ncbi:MAG: hypothetical protein JXR68_01075 [Bacteroidales bacterium]|nr:hypothetical protein [Bacteroidales bacterium]